MKEKRALWQKRFQELQQELASLGYILQGTVTNTTMTRPRTRRTSQTKTLGPHYQWTWKKGGKTVTVCVSAEQAQAIQQAIAENRRLESILAEMRSLSLVLIEATASTSGIKRRKYRSMADFMA
jgi:hypothetical protein